MDRIKLFTEFINRSSLENESNTPDFILGQFLESCLTAFETATNQRIKLFGGGTCGYCIHYTSFSKGLTCMCSKNNLQVDEDKDTCKYFEPFETSKGV